MENTEAREVGRVENQETGLSFVESVSAHGSARIQCTGLNVKPHNGYDPLVRIWHNLRKYAQVVQNADAVLNVVRTDDGEIVCNFYLNYGHCPIVNGIKCAEIYSARFVDVFSMQASHFEQCIEVFLEHPLGNKAYMAYTSSHDYASFEELDDVIDQFMVALGIRPPKKPKKVRKEKKGKKTGKVQKTRKVSIDE